VDVEALFTDLDLNRGAFNKLSRPECEKIKGKIRRCLQAYFKSIRGEASLYKAFADKVAKGDVVITFNYDVSLENELAQARKFRVRDGYAFDADWNEPRSDVTILKIHGSINWIGSLFGGVSGGSSGAFTNSLGNQPLVDNTDSVLSSYPPEVLDKGFSGGGVLDASSTLILPTYEKQFSITTSVGDEWASFFESLWCKAAESLQGADRIVIIGYSMPEADRRSRAILLWNANKRAEILLCCASSSAAMRVQFENQGFWRVSAWGDFQEFLRA
jgi:hypothetical protein